MILLMAQEWYVSRDNGLIYITKPESEIEICIAEGDDMYDAFNTVLKCFDLVVCKK